ncbi:MAG: DUF503 domain-containing protein [bacterium]|nr:DUF503 domain-containing protein [bacterium]
MVIGVCEVELYIPNALSLKDKRRYLQGLIKRIRNNFNASVVELDYKDKWQRALIGIACIDERQREIDTTFSEIISYISREKDLELVNYSIEMF